MKLAAAMALVALVACARPASNQQLDLGSSVVLEPGRSVMLLKVASTNEAERVGLNPKPGESLFHFGPLVTDLGGPSGICLIHAGKVTAFKTTVHAL